LDEREAQTTALRKKQAEEAKKEVAEYMAERQKRTENNRAAHKYARFPSIYL
tara:strand:+ start:346 stop:501 length:156 start_codon:yes stop_codon:yes gene_type:complete